MNQIHVLHIVPGLLPGGMETTLARLVRSFEGSHIRHSVVCLKGEAVIADRFPSSTDIYCLHSRPNDPLLPWKLWRLIRRLRPDVLHARNWGAWPDVALARLFVWPPVPLVFSFHGFAHTGCLPLRRRLAFRLLSRMTTYPLTVCDAAKTMLIEKLGWPSRNVRVIPNGVDLTQFSPRPEKHPASDRIVIACVGSLTPVKNNALLIQAFATLVHDGIDCELRLAGNGPELSKLEELAKELGVVDRILFVGHLENVPEFLGKVDVFALPSTSEAHPNALLEAMACGLPCVATDVGGVREVLNSGRFGLLVPPGNPQELAKCLGELCTDSEARRSLGVAARERVADRYSLERMVLAYADLYGEASSRFRVRHHNRKRLCPKL